MSNKSNDPIDYEAPKHLVLITPEEFAELPDGTELVCINGKTYIKGKDIIDSDTRGGHLAYGRYEYL